MKAARRTFWIVLGLIALGAGLTWLVAKGNQEETGAIAERLHLLQRHEIKTNQDVERVRLGLQFNYDQLVDDVRSIDRLLVRLRRDFSLLSQAEAPEVNQALRDYTEAFEKKKQDIEDFKSSNAIFRNSLSFLPHASTYFIDGLQGGQGDEKYFVHDSMIVLSGTLSVVSGNVGYDKAPYTDALRRLNAALKTLPRPAADSLRIFLRHNVILRRAFKRTSDLVGRILKSETVAQSTILFIAFDTYLFAGQAQQAVQRRVMIFGAVCIFGLIVFLLRCQNNYQNNLESNVNTRTADLRVAKAKAEQAEKLALSAAAAATAASIVKSEFLANMSHELRTPLNAIIGFSEIMRNGSLGPIGNPKYFEYAKDINDSGQHLLAMINGILDLSKIETGMLDLHESDVDVLRAIGSCFTLLKEQAETGDISFVHHASRELPPLNADEHKLKQILINLLTNAIKFTPDGGSVDLFVEASEHEGFIFTVSDTGIGIARGDIPAALAPFQQIHSDLSRKYEGTGLGLPLTKSLVELHGGSLDLRSEVGVGTTVTVRFPAARIVLKAKTGT